MNDEHHGKQVQKWADNAMWSAPQHDDPQHPKVTLTMAPADPLGQMAMVNGMYVGKIYTSAYQITDAERRQAWQDFAKSKLSETPAEWFQVSILFENVTRAFTHQLVRTRLATYAQESLRFAVKEDLSTAVKLPPSLVGVEEEPDPRGATEDQLKLGVWNTAVRNIDAAYRTLVESGMPAEDARGLLPTNVLTRVHMRTDIKTLINMAGMRLCTQAQFEWREVFAQLAKAFREYRTEYVNTDGLSDDAHWQWKLVSKAFQPVCYRAGYCPVKASADRTCTIRNRVTANAEVGRKSEEWSEEYDIVHDNPILSGAGPHSVVRTGTDGAPVFIGAIAPIEWLADHTAARRNGGGHIGTEE